MKMIERTIPYKTWIKESFVESLSRVMSAHPDDLLKRTNVGIEYPTERANFPAIVIRYIELNIFSAGVGHEEVLEIDGFDYRFKHYAYKGYIEFATRALSAYDSDLLADTLVQMVGMGDLTDYTNEFLKRIYGADHSEHPAARYNFVNVNRDTLRPVGDTAPQAPPWNSEDDLIYSGGYRIDISGEFYSLPPDESHSLDYIDQVDSYPYLQDIDPIPEPHPEDSTEWQPPIVD